MPSGTFALRKNVRYIRLASRLLHAVSPIQTSTNVNLSCRLISESCFEHAKNKFFTFPETPTPFRSRHLREHSFSLDTIISYSRGTFSFPAFPGCCFCSRRRGAGDGDAACKVYYSFSTRYFLFLYFGLVDAKRSRGLLIEMDRL